MRKTRTDNCLSLKVWWLTRQTKAAGGYLRSIASWNYADGETAGASFEASLLAGRDRFVRLTYKTPGDGFKKERFFDYKINIVATPCHFGGFRYWFICPLGTDGQACGRRVAVLYKNGDYFGCRSCQDIAYRSQNDGRRSGTSALFRFCDIRDEIERLVAETKRHYYRGRLTKKQCRIERLCSKASTSYGLMLGMSLAMKEMPVQL